MTETRCAVPTPHASRYLQQLCKHWGHKFEVSFDENHGTIALPFGALSLDAEDVALHIAIALAPGKEADRAEAVVAEHLGRFAFREGELVFAWRRA